VVELSVRAEEGTRVLEREGERCRVLRGWSLPFIVVARAGTGGNRLWLMALTPLIAWQG
jgi:hypothetical protein